MLAVYYTYYLSLHLLVLLLDRCVAKDATQPEWYKMVAGT